MAIWALADLHLSFSTPDKSMEFFGPLWKDYHARIKKNWEALVQDDDLVLIPGDISWAMDLKKALIDLEWIDKLPGKKLLLRGNHDYWWASSKKMREALPSTISFIHCNSFTYQDTTIAGSRLWDTPEYSFNDFVHFQENPRERKKDSNPPDNELIFKRELIRLEESLRSMDPKAKHRIAMTHYPPIGADLAPSITSTLLEKYNIEICLFGHLHNIKKNSLNFGKIRGVNYQFVSADYIDFMPIKVL